MLKLYLEFLSKGCLCKNHHPYPTHKQKTPLDNAKYPMTDLSRFSDRPRPGLRLVICSSQLQNEHFRVSAIRQTLRSRILTRIFCWVPSPMLQMIYRESYMNFKIYRSILIIFPRPRFYHIKHPQSFALDLRLTSVVPAHATPWPEAITVNKVFLKLLN